MPNKKTQQMVLTALFTAIIIIMAFVPYLGYINLVVSDWLALPVAGAVGALTNTLLVMNLIYFCFREQFAAAKQIALEAVCKALKSYLR